LIEKYDSSNLTWLNLIGNCSKKLFSYAIAQKNYFYKFRVCLEMSQILNGSDKGDSVMLS
jgi:hypothetical protein